MMTLWILILYTIHFSEVSPTPTVTATTTSPPTTPTTVKRPTAFDLTYHDRPMTAASCSGTPEEDGYQRRRFFCNFNSTNMFLGERHWTEIFAHDLRQGEFYEIPSVIFEYTSSKWLPRNDFKFDRVVSYLWQTRNFSIDVEEKQRVLIYDNGFVLTTQARPMYLQSYGPYFIQTSYCIDDRQIYVDMNILTEVGFDDKHASDFEDRAAFVEDVMYEQQRLLNAIYSIFSGSYCSMPSELANYEQMRIYGSSRPSKMLVTWHEHVASLRRKKRPQHARKAARIAAQLVEENKNTEYFMKELKKANLWNDMDAGKPGGETPQTTSASASVDAKPSATMKQIQKVSSPTPFDVIMMLLLFIVVSCLLGALLYKKFVVNRHSLTIKLKNWLPFEKIVK